MALQSTELMWRSQWTWHKLQMTYYREEASWSDYNLHTSSRTWPRCQPCAEVFGKSLILRRLCHVCPLNSDEHLVERES